MAGLGGQLQQQQRQDVNQLLGIGGLQQQQAQVQDLSYSELRARLPESISNDVVNILANSKQALLDFANIRDQQDVDEFNQRYNVNLTIPQEG